MRQKRRVFSSEEDLFLKANWETMSGAEMGRRLGRHENSIRTRLKGLGLYLSDELRMKFKTSGFVHGWNKGTKGYMSAKQKENGKVRDNVYDIGSVRVVKCGGVEYKQIKVRSDKWEFFHRVNWVAVNGEVPSGCLLRCIDGNSLNVEAENWLAVSKSSHRVMNGAGEILSDRYVAKMMAFTDKDVELRDELVKSYPELIELKRQSILLNREIKNK